MIRNKEQEPFDQLDAAILLEVLSEKIKGKKRRIIHHKCRQYVETLRNAKISIPAFGEVAKVIAEMAKEEFNKAQGFIYLITLLHEKEILFNAPQKEALQTVIAIMDFDHQIEPQDALRIAEAKEAKAKRFVTLDERLVTNSVLQEKFEIHIEFPWGSKPIES